MAGQLSHVKRDGQALLIIEATGLRQAEVENLRLSPIGDEEIRRFDVAVHDPGGMRRIQASASCALSSSTSSHSRRP